ncbi:CLIP domain-containing serine protease B14-like [Uranotaenia lowii]|uniref:CLIP domain-containing serine protease B14-like n=1 Tax=Uranotaenia lowii TaxID=190385 RepID=UPI002479770A|nr:CLIP domain-containing serine protease B14-like [Uranotaenia lowii]
MILLRIVVLLIPMSAGFAEELDPCSNTPYDSSVMCIPLQNCSYIINNLNLKKSTQSKIIYLSENTCCYHPSLGTFVSCPTIDSDHPCDAEIMVDKIFGGESADIRQFPWVVLILHSSYESPICGGSLINSNHILSAAHCFDPPDPEQ